MYKKLINKHLMEARVSGLATTEKTQKEEGKFNKEYYKDVEKKMKDYDGAAKQEDDNAIDPPKKEYSSEEEEYHDQMEIRNGEEMLKYDNEPTDQFKERAEMALKGDPKMGNKTYEGEWNPETGEGNGNTEEVWGASGGKHTGEEIVKSVKASVKKRNEAEHNIVQFGDDIENSGKKKTRGKARKVAVENKTNNNKPINETKMKRLRFNLNGDKPFNGVGNALQLIPENYRVDEKEFQMTDGNESYTIRWEGTLAEGRAIVLTAEDAELVNEDIQHMKHLMDFSSNDTLGRLKGSERLDENSSFRDIMNKTKSLMTESTEEVTETEEVDESENIDGQSAPKGDWDDAKGPKGDNHADHIMEEDEEVTENDEVTEGDDINETDDVTEAEEVTETEDVNEGEEVLESLLDEGWRDFMGMEKGDVVQQRADEFNSILSAAEAKGLKVNREILTKQASDNKFRGKLIPVKGTLIYKAGASGLGKMAAGSGSQTAGM